MPSRMEKYYGHGAYKSKDKTRSRRNKSLYSEIYTYGKYSNIEGIAEIDKDGEVDLNKVREMINNRENYNSSRKYRRISSEKNSLEDDSKIQRHFEKLEEKNYDIRDVLKEARENKEPDDKERNLKNTQYNILKNLDLQAELKKETLRPSDDEGDDLREMIQTITNTSMLNKMGDVDLASDLLSDLKDDDTKVSEIKNINELMDDVNDDEKKSDEPLYDKSFFTSSLKLNKFDFVDGDDGKSGKNIFTIVIIVILVIIIIVSATVLIMKSFS